MLMFLVEDISEEELYKYTRNRWMFGRPLPRAARKH